MWFGKTEKALWRSKLRWVRLWKPLFSLFGVESFQCPLEEFIFRYRNLDIEFMSTYVNLDSI